MSKCGGQLIERVLQFDVLILQFLSVTYCSCILLSDLWLADSFIIHAKKLALKVV